jgi:excisionase family DNA binding protein
MPIQIGDMTLYNVKDLAEMLGVSESTIRKYLQQGTLKGKKMARKWYVPDESLQAYFMDLDLEEGDEQKAPDGSPEPAPEAEAEQTGAPEGPSLTEKEPPPPEEEPAAPEAFVAPEGPPLTEEEPALPEEEPAAPEVVEEAATVQKAGDWRAEVERIREEIGRLKREAERIEDLYVDPEDGASDPQP